MAEARQAVLPLPSLHLGGAVDPSHHRVQVASTEEGVSLFIPHPRYWIRSGVRFVRRLHTKMHDAVAPVPLSLLVALQTGAVAWLLTSKSSSWIRQSALANGLWALDQRQPLSRFLSTQARVAYLTFGTGFGVLAGFTFVQRMLLRVLLSYHGWMDEIRGRKSIKTVVWGLLLKYVYMRGGLCPTFANQTSLPRQPVPRAEDTVERYLASMEPLLTQEEFNTLRDEGKSFIRLEAPKLQRYLKLRYWTTTNYVSEWWLDVVYLRGRDSLMINSNYYGLSAACDPPTSSQAARAAMMVHQLLKVKQEFDHERVPRMMIQGVVPLCMDQYRYAFTNREPHPEQDKLVVHENSRHIVVMCRGRFFKLQCFCGKSRKLLTPLQLEAALKGILAATKTEDFDSIPERKLAALTALDRTKWAEIRDMHLMRDRANKIALAAVEKAIFTIALDDAPSTHDNYIENAHRFMHGTGYDRWFDKSMQYIFCSNGLMGTNGEHAWGDAPAGAHIFEMALAREARLAVKENVYLPGDGGIRATPEEEEALRTGKLQEHRAERLLWNVTPELADDIEAAAVQAKDAISQLHLHCGLFDAFGKGLMKRARCSPDGFIQMALQLAYFRDQGHFTQTYESAMARLFRDGRTETIRSATAHATEFVQAMEDPDNTDEQRAKLLQAACANHTRLTALAMTGRGVDRHLFALYVVAVGTGMESAFLKAAIGRGWKLSTSQIPQTQTEGEWFCKDEQERYGRQGGGFAPVADDGYGVCYTVPGENRVFVHVSAKRPCPKTDAERFYGRIGQAFHDLAALFPDVELKTLPKPPKAAPVDAPASK